MSEYKPNSDEVKSKRERELEDKEGEKVNFVDIFNQRLASVPVLSKEVGQNRAWWYGIKGVSQVQKDVPALIFVRYDEDYQEPPEVGLWVAKGQMKGEDFKHDVLYDELNAFRERNGLERCEPFSYISSYLVQDTGDKKYLFFEPTPAGNLDDREKYGDWPQFEDLAEKYGIVAFVKSSHEVGKTVIKPTSWVEKNRVNNYLQAMAEKYQMTNAEFLRLRTIYLAVAEGREKEAKEDDEDYEKRKQYVVPPFDLEVFAQQIVADREKE